MIQWILLFHRQLLAGEKGMSRDTHLLTAPNLDARTVNWIRRAFITFTILGWIALAWVGIQIASHIIQALLLLVIAALFAYALAPEVKFLERFMPRFPAVLIIYLVVMGLIIIFFYFTVITTLQQTREIVGVIRNVLTPGRHGQQGRRARLPAALLPGARSCLA